MQIYKVMSPLLKNVLSTKHVRIYPLEQILEAEEYYLKNMTSGKVLLSPRVNRIIEIDQEAMIGGELVEVKQRL